MSPPTRQEARRDSLGRHSGSPNAAEAATQLRTRWGREIKEKDYYAWSGEDTFGKEGIARGGGVNVGFLLAFICSFVSLDILPHITSNELFSCCYC